MAGLIPFCYFLNKKKKAKVCFLLTERERESTEVSKI